MAKSCNNFYKYPYCNNFKMLNAVIDDKYKGKSSVAILHSEGTNYFILKKIGYTSMVISLHKDYSDCRAVQIFRDVNLDLAGPIINEKLEDLKEKRITENDLELILQA